MSRDVKYIGMDVHKEAIVIAVLSDGGKLVMESIIETKASSLLQFIPIWRGRGLKEFARVPLNAPPCQHTRGVATLPSDTPSCGVVLEICAAKLTSRAIKFQRAEKFSSFDIDKTLGAMHFGPECIVCLLDDLPGTRKVNVETVEVGKMLKIR
jgi:hypothetical protein